MTGQNLWTAKGDARIDISAITEFLKATVVEARAVADERGALDPKKYVSSFSFVFVKTYLSFILIFFFFCFLKERGNCRKL